CDAVGKAGISALVKYTSVIRQLAYAAAPDSLDEYLQIGEKISRDCLMHFCNGVIELYGEEYLRRPTQTDVEKLYAFHENKHGFHGSNNDVNILRQSPILNDLKVGKASEVSFVANDVTYKWGYYLTDGIYPEWVVLMKSISQPRSNDVKRIRYKKRMKQQEKMWNERLAYNGCCLGSLRDAVSGFGGSISETVFGDVFEAEETEERDIEMGLLGNSKETRANLPIDIDEMCFLISMASLRTLVAALKSLRLLLIEIHTLLAVNIEFNQLSYYCSYKKRETYLGVLFCYA
nr:hypothetical protein [Tanacetum cinerariifolium]